MEHGGNQLSLRFRAGCGMEGEASMATDTVRLAIDDRVGDNFILLYGLDPMVRVRMRRENDGTMHCMDDKSNWCKHIEAMVKVGLDAEVMFASDAYHYGSAIKVPLVPSEGLYAEVRCGKAFEDTGAYQFDLVDPKRPLIRGLLDLQFLGFINPSEGEGRNVLRGMVYDWFRANVDLRTLSCSVSAHGFNQEQMMQYNLKHPDSKEGVSEAFGLWLLDNCRKCRFDMDNLFDMVPDK